MTQRNQDKIPPSDPNDANKLMTTQELMAYLSVSRTKLWQLVTNEGLPAFKMGGDYRYRKSEVDAWMERFRVKPEDPEP
ncbi:MAG: helix-turn-helix domain-containing protein [Pirellulaceae bacterium]